MFFEGSVQSDGVCGEIARLALHDVPHSSVMVMVMVMVMVVVTVLYASRFDSNKLTCGSDCMRVQDSSEESAELTIMSNENKALLMDSAT